MFPRGQEGVFVSKIQITISIMASKSIIEMEDTIAGVETLGDPYTKGIQYLEFLDTVYKAATP